MNTDLVISLVALAGVIVSSYFAYRNSRSAAKTQNEAQAAATEVEKRKVDRDDFITYTDKVTAEMQKMDMQLKRATGLLHISLNYIRDLRMAVLDGRRPLPEVPREIRDLEWYLDEDM